jgi:CDGSH iron-sulfur domain-containing protein 3
MTDSVKITPLVDGPLEVSGASIVCASDGTEIRAADTVYLCRCGASNKKPFCDGTHKKIDFVSNVEA